MMYVMHPGVNMPAKPGLEAFCSVQAQCLSPPTEEQDYWYSRNIKRLRAPSYHSLSQLSEPTDMQTYFWSGLTAPGSTGLSVFLPSLQHQPQVDELLHRATGTHKQTLVGLEVWLDQYWENFDVH